MSFHNVRLPEDVERGVSGGKRFRTDIKTLFSGRERRNVDWARARGRWDAGFGIQELTDLNVVRDFFYARRGSAYGFRFKEWSDYTIGIADTDTEQNVGVGDGIIASFDVFKRYTDAGGTYDHPATRLVSGTIRYFENGTEVFSNWSVDIDTGVITRSPVLADTVIVGVIVEYDVPVRFDIDDFNLVLEVFNAGSVPSVPVVELKERD